MQQNPLLVGVDVGCHKHHVAISGLSGIAKQFEATFGAEIAWVGPMISDDAKRILELKEKINALEKQMETLIVQSSLANLLISIPGFGVVCAAEIAGDKTSGMFRP